LLRSIPRIDANRRERLRSIEGLPPDLIQLPPGCKFSPRCPFRIERCFTDDPKLQNVAPDQEAACWVTMKRAYAEMGAAGILDTRPGAGSGIRPPKDLAAKIVDRRTLDAASVPEAPVNE
jgi:oligopeptide/dipeptide ABC transporter ATP-binding protein